MHVARPDAKRMGVVSGKKMFVHIFTCINKLTSPIISLCFNLGVPRYLPHQIASQAWDGRPLAGGLNDFAWDVRHEAELVAVDHCPEYCGNQVLVGDRS